MSAVIIVRIWFLLCWLFLYTKLGGLAACPQNVYPRLRNITLNVSKTSIATASLEYWPCNWHLNFEKPEFSDDYAKLVPTGQIRCLK